MNDISAATVSPDIDVNVDMPDVVRPTGHMAATASQCSLVDDADTVHCRCHCQHHQPSPPALYDSAPPLATGEGYRVMYAAARQPNGMVEPLPDLVNIHIPSTLSSTPTSQRPLPTPVMYHAVTAASNSRRTLPTHLPLTQQPLAHADCMGRWSKLKQCFEESFARCMTLCTTHLTCSTLVFLFLFAVIAIAVLVGIVRVVTLPSSVYHNNTGPGPWVYVAILIGGGAAVTCVLTAIFWKWLERRARQSLTPRSRSSPEVQHPPCRRLLVELNDTVPSPGPSRTIKALSAQSASVNSPRCVGTAARSTDPRTYWPSAAGPTAANDSPDTPPPSYASALLDAESTHGACRAAVPTHYVDSVERAARARRFCVATMPGSSACRLYVAGESAQCRMVPCTATCRHNSPEISLQR